jgi:cell division protein FtsZ
MPRIEELPVPAQNEIRARRGEMPDHQTLERKRMSLLQRLAQVGLGRREEKEPPFEPHTLAHSAGRNEGEPRSAPERRIPEQVPEYSRRSGSRDPALDSRGRPARGHIEDDELEIPAFLRRQAN